MIKHFFLAKQEKYLPRKKYFNCGRLHNFLNKLNCIQIKTPEVDWYMAICHNIYFVPELFVLLIPVSWKRKSYIFLEANSSCYQTYFQLSNPVVIETLVVQKVVVYGRCQVALTVVGQGYDVGIQWLPHPGIVTQIQDNLRPAARYKSCLVLDTTIYRYWHICPRDNCLKRPLFRGHWSKGILQRRH